MELKEILGSAYNEGMTLAEVEEAIRNSKSIVSKTDYDKLSTKSDKFSKEAGDLRKQLNANKSAEELAEQQRAQELQDLRDALAQSQKRETIMEIEKTLLAMGYNEELANKSATALADNDIATYFKLQSQFNAEQQKRFTAQTLAETRLPNQVDTQDNPAMTKERLTKMSLMEQQKFSKEHPEEYQKLYK